MSDGKQPHSRLRGEERTVRAMVRIYCRSEHGARELCPECAEIAEYAAARLMACPYGEGKPTCANCSIHCYRPEMRGRMRTVMRFSGPRMLVHHPVVAVRHMVEGLRGAKERPGRSGSK